MTDTPRYPNWFDGQRYNFENHLTQFKGKNGLRFLQIGVFTGDASVWLLDNVLTGTGSVLIDVDTWKGSEEKEHEAMNFDDVFNTYRLKTQDYDKVVYFTSTSEEFFKSIKDTDFDFIYIDGDHTEAGVTSDATYAWKYLKSGGILAFDDYLWGQGLSPELTPKPAIDRFLAEKQGEYEILNKDYQIWLLKK